MTKKKCAKCCETKDRSEMYQEKSGARVGPATWCKDCVKTWTKKLQGKTSKAPQDH